MSVSECESETGLCGVTRHSLWGLPAGVEEVERLGEDIVVEQPGVDGEDSHQQDDVAATVHDAKYL